MIEKLAEGMASFYVQNDYISPKELNAYKYGFEILLSTVCNVALVLGIALLMKSFVGAVFYMTAFVAVRSAGGGYHAKNHRACILIFSVMFVAFCLLIKTLEGSAVGIYNLICTIISSLVIWKAAPVAAPNKPLSPEKRKRYRNICLAVGCGFMLLAITTYLAEWIPDHITVYIFSGEVAAALSIAVASIKKGEEDKA